MPPLGEIRSALRPAFEAMAPCGWRDVLTAAPINCASPAEVAMVRRTVENMVQAGELVPVGRDKPAGSRVWHALYEPAAWQEQPQQAPEEPCMRDECLRAIGVITSAWRQRVP